MFRITNKRDTDKSRLRFRLLFRLPAFGWRYGHRVDANPCQLYVLRAVHSIICENYGRISPFIYCGIKHDVNNAALTRLYIFACTGIIAHGEILLRVTTEGHTIDIEFLSAGIRQRQSSGLPRFFRYLLTEIEIVGGHIYACRCFRLLPCIIYTCVLG
jgi:hypothetical protein